MKFLAVILLAASVSFAADLSTGQAARLVIGQTTFTSQQSGTSQTLLGGVGGIAYANNTLFVTDANRVGAEPIAHRVLIYKNLSGMLPKPADELEFTQRCPVCVGTATLVLGQKDFESSDYATPPTAQSLRTPTAVATDGIRLAVADTDNNRVLIWNSIPSASQAPPDVVVGQPDFTTTKIVSPPTAGSLRGPQGVWIQNGKLFVADTSNQRVLIWNQIPTSNGAAADVVLGQSSFGALPAMDPAQLAQNVKATTLNIPVAVTSDGQRLFVTDLGYDRVLIWNSIPAVNQQPADVVIGQPDMTTWAPNNSPKLCPSNGSNDKGEPTYPVRCAATLETPRYALSDGNRLFIADGGNDRVLLFNSIPTENGAPADVVLGQQSMELNVSGSAGDPLAQASADSLRTPLALAWDGENLFVTDPFNRRIMVFTIAEKAIPFTGVRNLASRSVFAVGSVQIEGGIQKNDKLTIKIQDKEYTHTVQENDTLENVVAQLVNLINAGEGNPDVFAIPNLARRVVLLVSKQEGAAGNEVEYSVSSSPQEARIFGTAGGGRLAGGGDAAKIAPGTQVQILGEGLSEQTASAPTDVDKLPTTLGGVQVYIDGIRSPLLMVSPGQINAQIPFEIADSYSLSAYVRVQRQDGSVYVTNPVAVPVIDQNPGIFAFDGVEPRRAVATHFSSHATATISIDGSAVAGDNPVVIVEDRKYSYIVQEGDNLVSVRDAFVELVKQDPRVEPFPSGIWSRLRLKARVPGPEGNGIRIAGDVGASTAIILTPFNESTCCANVAGSLVTEENPALPGETIVIYATGLGFIKPDIARQALTTGGKYTGPELNEPVTFVSSMAGGKTANVLYTGMKPGTFSLFEVHLELNSAQPSNPLTPLTIAQDVYVSNIVTIPVYNPNPDAQ